MILTVSSVPNAFAGHDPFDGFRADHARVLAHLDLVEPRLGLDEALDESLVRELVAHLSRQFATHMTAEDAVLYPALDAAFPEGRRVLEPLRADHAELRDLLALLAKTVDLPRTPRRDERLAVAMRDFVDLLRIHIHKEESAVFDVVPRVLDGADLDALALRLAPFLGSEDHPGA